MTLSFRDARDLAAEFGAQMPAFSHTSPATACWIDRIQMLPMAAAQGDKALAKAIEDADRYSGRK